MKKDNYICFILGWGVAMLVCSIVNVMEPKRLEITIMEPITAKLDVSDLTMGALK